ncbi:MAG TPA: class I SAM-dependent methyltransferase [Thermoanaerobaculia bacterium]
MSFEDHFSGHAADYARHRPRYPDELFAWLASQSPRRELAWDAGTGSGQVAAALAHVFDRVIATDASAEQLARATPHDRVEYRHEPSGHSSLDAGSVDLVTAGAAAHWFDLDAFYREIARVGRKGTLVALFSYGPRDFADLTGPAVHRFNTEILGPYWPERIQYVDDRYTTLPFPFEEIAAPPFFMTAEWTLWDLVAFLETWSASQRYFVEHGTRATAEILPELTETWGGDPNERRELRCPIFVRAGYL